MTRVAYPAPRVGEPVLYFENSARRRAAASTDLQATKASLSGKPSRLRILAIDLHKAKVNGMPGSNTLSCGYGHVLTMQYLSRVVVVNG